MRRRALNIEPSQQPGADQFHWSAGKVVWSLGLFVAAGVCEIGGGWLVWQAIRERRPFWWAILGALVLVGYGFVPTAQPTSNFGRIYAVYGGFFILLSYFWGWVVDKVRPDVGDFVGGGIAIAGVLVAWFWPRLGPEEESGGRPAPEDTSCPP